MLGERLEGGESHDLLVLHLRTGAEASLNSRISADSSIRRSAGSAADGIADGSR
jgi:hypothetical protein